jgi:hypothetical protein
MGDMMVQGVIVFAAVAAVIVPASWRIASKAGYKPAISLLMIVSPVNLCLLVAFAVKEWPVERELRIQRGRVG